MSNMDKIKKLQAEYKKLDIERRKLLDKANKIFIQQQENVSKQVLLGKGI